MTSREATARLKGLTVVRVEMRAFRDGRGAWAHSPVIFFNDGTTLSFVTEETADGDEYGTALVIVR